MPLLALVFAAALSTVPTEKHVDFGWGVLARSSHLHGAWRIELDNGTRITGDWIVINREAFVTRDMGGGGGPAKAIHFVDSKSSRHCSLDADQPAYLYCVDRIAGYVQLARGATLALPKGTTALDAHHPVNGVYVPAGRIVVDAKPKAPTLAELEMLFERTVGTPLASWLGATASHARGVLVLSLPLRQADRLGANATYSQEVVVGIATIRIGPAPATLAITAHETDRFVEDCVGSAIHNGPSGSGCMPAPPPMCTRRP